LEHCTDVRLLAMKAEVPLELGLKGGDIIG
jgi:hypothetical protein